MTTVYSQIDVSAHDGKPYELYAFEGVEGNYYYTNHHVAIEFGGNVYEAVQISRSTVETGSLADSPVTSDFNLSVTTAMFKKIGGLITPPALTVTVYRRHRGATGWRKITLGILSGHSVNQQLTTYTVSVKNKLQTEINRSAAPVYFQNQCNNIFGDERCLFDITLVTEVANVVSITRTTVQTDGAFTPGAYVGGTIRLGYQRRLIIANSDTGFEIAYPFGEDAATEVTVIQGCDRSYTTCRDKFNNVLHYTGFKDIPSTNPADSPLNAIIAAFLATKKADTVTLGKTHVVGEDTSNNIKNGLNFLQELTKSSGTNPYDQIQYDNPYTINHHAYAGYDGKGGIMAGTAGTGQLPKDTN